MIAGYVVTCVGDDGPYTYKRSRNGNSLADRVATHVISQSDGIEKAFLDFVTDRGSDERQNCSPGFNLPVGSMTRTMYSDYPEYHTSLDNRDFISFKAMTETVDMYYRIMLALDRNVTYRSLNPFGEPQLGRRGLMATLATRGIPEETSAILWVLCFADGDHDLLSIAERSGRSLELLHSAAERCVASGLLERIK